MATLPPTANPSQQPLNLEDEDGILDECDQYSLAHPCVGKVFEGAPRSALPLLIPCPAYLSYLIYSRLPSNSQVVSSTEFCLP